MALAGGVVIALLGSPAPPGSAGTVRAEWDPRVRPVAREVERIRGLVFERPVTVEFLARAEFEHRVGGGDDESAADDHADVERAAAQLRAIGLLASGVDLRDAVSSLRKTGALGYYDPATATVMVRGTKLDVAKRVTLVHELTHALQDQHFDLQALQREARRSHSEDALRALVEGDAVRVQDLYVGGLPEREQRAYARRRGAQGIVALDAIRAAGVPEALVVFFQSPYTLGPPMLKVATALDGHDAIDAWFRDPPDADAAFVTPASSFDASARVAVEPPALLPGESASGDPDVFGAFALYLMLAARVDPLDALRVADGWGGDAMVTFTRGGVTCIRATFAGRNPRASTAIADALQAWANRGPTGAAEVAADGASSTLTACEPGETAEAVGDSPLAALVAVAVRNELLAGALDQGVGLAVAECTANGVVRHPSFRPVLQAAAENPNAVPDASVLAPFQRNAATVVTRCAR